MNQCLLPLVVEPEELQAALTCEEILIVDLSPPYHQSHVPNSVHLDYARLIRSRPPITGLLPEPEQLSALFSSLGLTTDRHVVAYDDEGGGKACRLLWTLDVAGHERFSLLNGGLNAWLNEHHLTSKLRRDVATSSYRAHINDKVIANKRYILDHLYEPTTVVVDCRSPSEYAGHDVRAQRGGHIPGAVNMEWTRAIDQHRNLRIKSPYKLRSLFAAAGVTPDKEIITYCHSHRRSAFGYFVLRSLGYPRIRGYPGSWSEWGNDPHTPIEL
jgi:thiosulfate/3-mercaptopyruvate sulfurtransferase